MPMSLPSGTPPAESGSLLIKPATEADVTPIGGTEPTVVLTGTDFMDLLTAELGIEGTPEDGVDALIGAAASAVAATDTAMGGLAASLGDTFAEADSIDPDSIDQSGGVGILAFNPAQAEIDYLGSLLGNARQTTTPTPISNPLQQGTPVPVADPAFGGFPISYHFQMADATVGQQALGLHIDPASIGFPSISTIDLVTLSYQETPNQFVWDAPQYTPTNYINVHGLFSTVGTHRVGVQLWSNGFGIGVNVGISINVVADSGTPPPPKPCQGVDVTPPPNSSTLFVGADACLDPFYNFARCTAYVGWSDQLDVGGFYQLAFNGPSLGFTVTEPDFFGNIAAVVSILYASENVWQVEVQGSGPGSSYVVKLSPPHAGDFRAAIRMESWDGQVAIVCIKASAVDRTLGGGLPL